MRPLLVAALGLVCACGSSASRQPLRLTTADQQSPASGNVRSLQMQTSTVQQFDFLVLNAGGAPAFSGSNLPGFVTLDGPVLTIAPARTDVGSFNFSVSASIGGETASMTFALDVIRENLAPRLNRGAYGFAPWVGDTTATPMFVDTWYTQCPGGCTVLGTAVIGVGACDPEGDALTVDVEVVPVGQAFQHVPTVSKTFQAPACPALAKPPADLLAVPLAGLVPQQNYTISVRVTDAYGAVWPFPNGGWQDQIGWASYFEQGPCTDQQCACMISTDVPPAPARACRRNSDCCSGKCDGDPDGSLPPSPLVGEQFGTCIE
jgi:hypothetical protein